MNSHDWHEYPIVFDCEGNRLIGIITHPAKPAAIGVIIIVGGPQYRAGSHRQFTLLARHLATQGIASIRFDYRGMGDSEGEMRNFEHIDADIRAAIDVLQLHAPTVRQVALWGLCDAASAALYYGHTDTRITQLILLNPWVHSPATAAQARLKGYYLKRLLQPSFWRKFLTGKVNAGKSIRDIASAADHSAARHVPLDPRHGSADYVEKMLTGLQSFKGHTLILLSGSDLTAQEFMALIKTNKHWKKTCFSPKINREIVTDANHTFSTHGWRSQVETRTSACIRKGL